MPRISKTASDIDLPQLQIDLQRHESIRRGGLTAISAESDDGRYTKGVHESPRVPKRSLRVLEDPAGTIEAPPTTTLVCRGTAWIGDYEKKVALFRTT